MRRELEGGKRLLDKRCNERRNGIAWKWKDVLNSLFVYLSELLELSTDCEKWIWLAKN